MLLVFIALNLLLMVTLFLVGVYLFMQVEEKRKQNKFRLFESNVDITELRAMLQAQRHDEALQRLMQVEDVDRYTAERALEALRQRVPGQTE